MMRLLSAEFNRLRSRRMTWIILAVAVIMVGLLSWANSMSMKPPSASEVAQATQAYNSSKAEFEAHKEEMLASCTASGQSADDCTPKLEHFLPPTPTHTSVMASADATGSSLGGMLALILGGSLIGAEYRSGSLGNWLTFVPRRGRVYVTKAAVVVAASAIVGAVVLVGLSVVGTVIFRSYYPTAALDAHAWESTARAVAIVAAEGLFGFVIALVTRQTAAAVGVAFGGQLVESIMQGLAMYGGQDWLLSLLPSNNISAFIQNGYKFTIYRMKVTPQGTSQEAIEKLLPFANGAAYLGVALVVLVAGSFLVFRRRDVN
jgi:ABC-2 type transport system permease protein